MFHLIHPYRVLVWHFCDPFDDVLQLSCILHPNRNTKFTYLVPRCDILEIKSGLHLLYNNVLVRCKEGHCTHLWVPCAQLVDWHFGLWILDLQLLSCILTVSFHVHFLDILTRQLFLHLSLLYLTFFFYFMFHQVRYNSDKINSSEKNVSHVIGEELFMVHVSKSNTELHNFLRKGRIKWLEKLYKFREYS